MIYRAVVTNIDIDIDGLHPMFLRHLVYNKTKRAHQESSKIKIE